MKEFISSYVVMVGSAGAAAALKLAEEHRDVLEKRFPNSFLSKENELETEQERIKGIALPEFFGEAVVQTIGADGVFKALWNLAETFECGLIADLLCVPVHQFTIELFELLDRNPYTADAGAGFLLVSGEPEAIVDWYRESGIRACTIGRLKSGKQRLLQAGEITRFLTPDGE